MLASSIAASGIAVLASGIAVLGSSIAASGIAALARSGGPAQAPVASRFMADAPLKRLWRYAANRRRAVVVASTYSVLNRLFDLAPPFLIGMAVDIVVREESSLVADVFGVTNLLHQLFVLGAVNAVIWALESSFQYLFQIRWRGLAQDIQHDARLDAWRHIQTLDMAWFEDRSTGGLLAILNDDVNQLERFLDRGANDILQTATTVIAVGLSFLILAPQVAPLAFLPVPLIVWGSFRFQRKLEPRYLEVRERAGDLATSFANDLGGIATIKAFGAHEREVERIRVESARYRDSNAAAIRVSSAFVPLIPWRSCWASPRRWCLAAG